MIRKTCPGWIGLAVCLGFNLAFTGAGMAGPRAELGETGKMQALISAHGIDVRLYYLKKTEGSFESRQPKLEIRMAGKTVLTVDGEDSGMTWPNASVQIVEMDAGNPYPEVVFASYSGGAHCCNIVRIATSSAGGKTWRNFEAGSFNGDVSGASDVDGDGRYEMVTRDNRFYYMFSSYAGSLAPTQIKALQNGKLVDVTRQAGFRPFVLKEHKKLREFMGDIRKAFEKNGYLAGYVAQSALLGGGKQAWEFMLRHYDRKSIDGLVQCMAGLNDQGKCKAPEVNFTSFPQALDGFLRHTGYLPAR